jgi:hypothetical protein
MANYQPAFPVTFRFIIGYDTNNQPIYSEQQDAGMTLRDYFATKALSAMEIGFTVETAGADHMARNAYTIADAMLKARVQS